MKYIKIFYCCLLARNGMSFLGLMMLMSSSCKNHEREARVAMQMEAVWIARSLAGNREADLRELIENIEAEKGVAIESNRWIKVKYSKAESREDIVVYSTDVIGGESLAIHSDLSVAWHETNELNRILRNSTN